MGLKVSTIARLPLDSDREYFVYFLDYGWDDSFSEVMYNNFDNFASGLAGQNGLVIAGLNRQEFADEVLSWHSLNGEPTDELLPAILVSGCHPEEFRRSNEFGRGWSEGNEGVRKHDGAILIPLRDVCKSPDDVVPIISSILGSIRNRQKIEEFDILRQMGGSDKEAEIFVLQPNFYGIGVDLKAIWQRCSPYFSKRNKET